ncbi:12429_t:CDS:2 [Ambispora gerdemannii]|uniref:12429_t:CDS:1 n=1 Tax=Ambispora gerdemannii TaxID=144530 RepID=A0A9N9FAM1_9GLOM|nr:12429_t:CDS:2 [Ambispora gerdemannii]
MKKLEEIKKQINDNSQGLVEEFEKLQKELQGLQIEKENEVQQLKEEIKRLKNNSVDIKEENNYNNKEEDLIEENYEIEKISYQQPVNDHCPRCDKQKSNDESNEEENNNNQRSGGRNNKSRIEKIFNTCAGCQKDINTAHKIFQNQEVNVDNLNISTENKEQLKALAKIKKGEQIDIDRLNIDQEAKEELKEIQKQISTNSPVNKPQQKSQNTSDYVVNCLNCSRQYETNKEKEPHSNCWYCQSKNIQI